MVAPGSNGKMNAFQAAMGVLQLQYHEGNVAKRRVLVELYDAALAGVDGLRLPPCPSGVELNYSYYPVLFESEAALLKAVGIRSRRYFYPLISDFPAYRHLPSAEPGRLPVAKQVAEEVLCLPIYPDLEPRDVGRIAGLLREAIG